jgi:hypothetical protein
MIGVESLSEIVKQLFPVNAGILLTGSQRQKTVFHAEKDIDLIVLVYFPGNMVNSIRYVGEFALDFTLLPLSDLEAILLNEKDDLKGILLDKLRNGVIIEDKSGLVRLLVDKATEWYGQMTYHREHAFRLQVTNLKKLSKYFFNRNDQYSIAVRRSLLNDWYTYITNIEGFRQNGYLMGPYHKHSYLEEHLPRFVEDITSVIDQARQANDFSPLLEYTAFYTRLISKTGQLLPAASTDCIMHIDYEGLTLPQFVLYILPALTGKEPFANSFQYLFIPSPKYFRANPHKLCIALKVPEGDFRLYKLRALINTTVSSFYGERKIKFAYTIEESTKGEEPYKESLKQLRISLYELLCSNLYAYPEEQETMNYFTTFQLLDMLVTETQINQKDFFMAAGCLLQNLIFQKSILTNKPDKLKNQHEAFVKNAEDEYLRRWSSFLPSQISSRVFPMNEKAKLSMDKVRSALQQFLAQSISENVGHLTFLACKQYGFKHMENALRFLVATGEGFTFSNLTEDGKAKALYAYSRAVKSETLPA